MGRFGGVFYYMYIVYFSAPDRAQIFYASAVGCLWDPQTLTPTVQSPQAAIWGVKHRILPPYSFAIKFDGKGLAT